MIIVIRRNIDKASGFPDLILGDICYRPTGMCLAWFKSSKLSGMTWLNLRKISLQAKLGSQANMVYHAASWARQSVANKKSY